MFQEVEGLKQNVEKVDCLQKELQNCQAVITEKDKVRKQKYDIIDM